MPALAIRDLPGSQSNLGKSMFLDSQATLTPFEITFTQSSIEGGHLIPDI